MHQQQTEFVDDISKRFGILGLKLNSGYTEMTIPPLQQKPVISVPFSFLFSVHYPFKCIFHHFLDKVDTFPRDGIICIHF